MEQKKHSTHRLGAPNLPISSPGAWLRNAFKRTPLQTVCRGRAEEWQKEPLRSRFLCIVLKREDHEAGTSIATEKPPTAAVEELSRTESTHRLFPNAHLACVWQARTKLAALAVEMMAAHTKEVIPYIVLDHPEMDGSGGDNSLSGFAKSTIPSDMFSSRPIVRAGMAAKNTVVSEYVIWWILDKVARSDLLRKTISVFAGNQMYHPVQIEMAEKRFWHSR